MTRYLRLLTNRSLVGLTLAQFLTAVNDNALKQVFLLLVVASTLESQGGGTGYAAQAAATALFAVPFLVFSVWAGQAADRWSKQWMVVVCKAWEIGVMALAGLGVWMGSLGLLLLALLLMATQSTFFSPAKYGILPELLSRKRLSAGNGLIQMTTYFGIMAGTALAGFLLQRYEGQPLILAGTFVALSLLGWLASLLVQYVPAADPDRTFRWNLIDHFSGNLTWIARKPVLLVSTVAYALVWFVGNILLLNLNVYGLDTLGLSYQATSLLVVVTGSGMAVGCLLAGWWSGDGVEFGLVLPASLGMGLLLLVLTNPLNQYSVGGLLFFAGACGGLYMIPLLTALQDLPDPERKGDVLATANIFTFVGMIVSSGLYALAVGYGGWTAPELMGALGWFLLALVVALPLANSVFLRRTLRLGLVCLGRVLYRHRVKGKIEELRDRDGGALVLSNHVSYLDWFFVGVCFHRLPRFVILGHYHQIPVLGWLLKVMNTIPINPSRPKQTQRALDEIRSSLEAGELVVVFPEGSITRTGQLLGIRPGVEKILESASVPVVPVYLDNLWGRWWTYAGGRLLWKWPRKMFQPVYTWVGEVQSPDSGPEEIFRGLQELESRAREARYRDGQGILTRFIKAFRGRFWQTFGQDGLGVGPLRRGSALVGTLALSIALRRELDDSKRVGVMVPPSVGGWMVNVALNLIGRSAVNLNLTLPESELRSCLDKSGVRALVTAPEVLDELSFEPDERVIDIRQLQGGIQLQDWAMAACFLLLPATSIVGWLGGHTDPTVEHGVVFTSGTTGEPKGVRISGVNVLANLDGLDQVLGLNGEGQLVSVLPFFHALGYVAGIWGPGLGLCSVNFYHNPREVRSVAARLQTPEASLFVAVPSLYELILRREGQECFRGMDHLISGAEPLSDELEEEFREQVGVPLRNGYGCSEMTPGVSTNAPDVELWDGSVQEGTRPGTVGRALPGVALKVVDPETGDAVDFGQSGEIFCKGPARMMGYVDRDAGGDWFATGDRGCLDEDGFLTVDGRYDRFTKRGGEMIPHRTVQERAREQLQELVDPDKEVDVGIVGLVTQGEETMGLITNLKESPENVRSHLLDHPDLPASWVPSVDHIVTGQEVPRRAMGSMNLAEARENLRRHLESEEA